MTTLRSHKLAAIVHRNRVVIAHDIKWAVLMAAGLLLSATTLLPL